MNTCPTHASFSDTLVCDKIIHRFGYCWQYQPNLYTVDPYLPHRPLLPHTQRQHHLIPCMSLNYPCYSDSKKANHNKFPLNRNKVRLNHDPRTSLLRIFITLFAILLQHEIEYITLECDENVTNQPKWPDTPSVAPEFNASDTHTHALTLHAADE